MAKVKKILWTDVFFGLYIYADPRDNRKNVIILDVPERDNPFPRYLYKIFSIKIIVLPIFLSTVIKYYKED